jgi:hypothetical protein
MKPTRLSHDAFPVEIAVAYFANRAVTAVVNLPTGTRANADFQKAQPVACFPASVKRQHLNL